MLQRYTHTHTVMELDDRNMSKQKYHMKMLHFDCNEGLNGDVSGAIQLEWVVIIAYTPLVCVREWL